MCRYGVVMMEYCSSFLSATASVMMTEPCYKRNLTPLFRPDQIIDFGCLQSSSRFQMLSYKAVLQICGHLPVSG